MEVDEFDDRRLPEFDQLLAPKVTDTLDSPKVKLGVVNTDALTRESTHAIRAAAHAVNLRQFGTGAVRDSDADNTRYDLIPPQPMRRLAETYAEGAMKYSDHNWLKGMPYSVTINHVLRHINLWLEGDSSEDHLAHAAWGLFAIMTFDAMQRPELDDRYVWR